MSETNLAALKQRAANVEVIPGFNSAGSFEALQRISRAFSLSHFVPKEFQGDAGLPSCMIAVDIALRANAAPLLVMQNLIIVHGKPSWSAKYLIATANTCGRFSAIRFEYFGEQGQDSWGCRAVATELATGEKLIGPDITLKLAKDEGWYSKSMSKWKTMPQKMLMWRAGAWWVDLYAPEIAMGFRTQDEVEDIVDIDASGNVTNITPANEQSTDTLRRPRKKVVADIETLEPPTEQEQQNVITDGVNQSTGEIEGDFDVNPAAAAAAQNEFA